MNRFAIKCPLHIAWALTTSLGSVSPLWRVIGLSRFRPGRENVAHHTESSHDFQFLLIQEHTEWWTIVAEVFYRVFL